MACGASMSSTEVKYLNLHIFSIFYSDKPTFQSNRAVSPRQLIRLLINIKQNPSFGRKKAFIKEPYFILTSNWLDANKPNWTKYANIKIPVKKKWNLIGQEHPQFHMNEGMHTRPFQQDYIATWLDIMQTHTWQILVRGIEFHSSTRTHYAG